MKNPDFEYADVGAPPLSVIYNELLKRGEKWDGEVHCSKQKLNPRYLFDAIEEDSSHELKSSSVTLGYWDRKIH